LDLRIPPLRERNGDIPILIKSLIKKMNIKHDTNISHISNEAVKALEVYSWPGNVRELENFAEKMCILSSSMTVDEALINQLFSNNSDYNFANAQIKSSNEGQSITVNLGNLKEIEQQIIKQASKMFEGDRDSLAEKLGMSRTTLWKRLKEIEAPSS
jgi:DNA-binding NtrC family response regulator